MQPSPVVVQVPSIERHTLPAEVPGKNESYSAGVSWPAVIGGGFVFGALSLVLLVLGTGLGFSAISPWSNMNVIAPMIGKSAIA